MINPARLARNCWPLFRRVFRRLSGNRTGIGPRGPTMRLSSGIRAMRRFRQSRRGTDQHDEAVLPAGPSVAGSAGHRGGRRRLPLDAQRPGDERISRSHQRRTSSPGSGLVQGRHSRDRCREHALIPTHFHHPRKAAPFRCPSGLSPSRCGAWALRPPWQKDHGP